MLQSRFHALSDADRLARHQQALASLKRKATDSSAALSHSRETIRQAEEVLLQEQQRWTLAPFALL